MRKNGVGVYQDIIHQLTGTPAGPSVLLPSCGHEAWARAVRSCLSVALSAVGDGVSVITNGDFSNGTTGWVNVGGTISVANGQATFTSTTTGGVQSYQIIPATAVGDVIRVRFDVISFSGSGWKLGPAKSSDWDQGGTTPTITAAGPVDFTITSAGGSDRIWALKSPASGTLVIDNLQCTVAPAPAIIDTASPRPADIRPVPIHPVVSDYKAPGGARIVLPTDEVRYANGLANCGTIATTPLLQNGFVRRFNGQANTNDVLVLASGQYAIYGSTRAVGLSIVSYRASGDAATTVVVTDEDTSTTLATINLAAGGGTEQLIELVTPTVLATAGVAGARKFRVAVTAGTLRICAGVLLQQAYTTYNRSW